MSDKTYKYVGPGEGVPGLPHEITEALAKELGVADIFKAALKAGVYAEIKPKKEVKDG